MKDCFGRRRKACPLLIWKLIVDCGEIKLKEAKHKIYSTKTRSVVFRVSGGDMQDGLLAFKNI
jgi:hypothetical protein